MLTYALQAKARGLFGADADEEEEEEKEEEKEEEEEGVGQLRVDAVDGQVLCSQYKSTCFTGKKITNTDTAAAGARALVVPCGVRGRGGLSSTYADIC